MRLISLYFFIIFTLTEHIPFTSKNQSKIIKEEPLLISNISNHHYQIKFCSKNNPIPQFQINTNKGVLFVKEITAKDINNNNEYANEITKFFTDNFINSTKDPSLTKYKHPKNHNKYIAMLDRIKHSYINMFEEDDGNLTALEARNSKGELCGTVITNTFKDISGVFDNKTCYIDSVAVREDYRKNHIASKLIDKAIECSKTIYTDVLLISDNTAVPFHVKNGYRIMDYSNKAEKTVIDKINKFRGDYPDYVTYMDKKLDTISEPWYLRIYKKIKK